MDVIPGKMNSIDLEVMTLGYKIGQCSKLCGTGHAFMLMILKVMTLLEFIEICSLTMNTMLNFYYYNIFKSNRLFF